MSPFLILPLGFLLGGTVVSLLFARLRPRYSADAAAISAVIALIVWLFAGRNLPLSASDSASQNGSGIGLWHFSVDEPAWWLSFSVLLLLSASLVIMITAERYYPSGSRASFRRRLAPTTSLMVVAAVLLSLWSVTLPALATGWTLIAFTWALLVWSARKERRARAGIVARAGAMLLSLVFLGLAAASQPDMVDLAARPESWSDQARVWAMLAAVVQLGAFPFHWWRPDGAGYVIGTAGLVAIAPSAAGAHFISRLATSESGGGALFMLLLTAFGLMGIIYGTGTFWSTLDKRLPPVRAIALSQIGVILLAGAWASAAAVTLLAQVLILAIGGLFLGTTWPGRLSQADKLPMWVGVAAIAGVPLTAGFVGLSSLYGSQISEGSLVLALVTALLMVPVLAAAILLVWEVGDSKQKTDISRLGKITALFAFSLPALGLVIIPSSIVVRDEVSGWILILVSMLGAAAISWYMLRNPDVREALRGAFRFHLPLKTTKRVAESVAAGANTVIRETAAILEGEGGMLWLLLLVVIFWLARLG
jgi:NADH:ubiquinone oxidoreductase subunit 2 (subunit N)